MALVAFRLHASASPDVGNISLSKTSELTGEISEDVLRDGRKSFEQGLPSTLAEATDFSDSTNFTAFGRIPPLGTQAIVHSFDNENGALKLNFVLILSLISD